MGFFCPFSTKYIYLFFVSLRTVFSTKIHHAVFVSGVCLLAYGMMMGTVPTSVPQILLLANWLFEGRWRQKWEALRQNALFWLLVLVFFAHAAGLLYKIAHVIPPRAFLQLKRLKQERIYLGTSLFSIRMSDQHLVV
jgi:hypothetical protein